MNDAVRTEVQPREVGAEYRKVAPVWAVQMQTWFTVETLEGVMTGNPGDYLCQGPAGERWPIKKEIFEATYVPAPAPQQIAPDERRTMFAWQCVIALWAKEKGWYEDLRDPPAGQPWAEGEQQRVANARIVKLALITTEVAEAIEEVRRGKPLYYIDDNGKPQGLGIELADAAIRVLDEADQCGIDLEEMVAIKMAYNQKRPFRHGGKLA